MMCTDFVELMCGVHKVPLSLQLLESSFLRGLPSHLRSGGRAIVICSKPETFEHLLQTSEALGLKAKSLEEDFDNRDWESAVAPLVPAILFEIRSTRSTTNTPESS